MTIAKGEPWGTTLVTPFDLVVARDEESLARAVARGATHVELLSGDLLRALGGSASEERVRAGEPSLHLPCDIMCVRLDDRDPVLAVGSLRVGSATRPRAWLSTGGFLGSLNVAPRAHPNDGLLDALEFGRDLSFRQLLAVRRRMRLGDHLPHPRLSVHRAKEYEWSSDRARVRPARVEIDRRRHGSARLVRVVVKPDAFVLCAPLAAAR